MHSRFVHFGPAARSVRVAGLLWAARVLIASVLLVVAPSALALEIEYTVAPQPTGAEKTTQVSIRIQGLTGRDTLRLQMAVWSPGDYHVMNHSRYVRNVRAAYEADGRQPAITHPDANTWEVSTGGHDALRVSYTLPNTPPGFFSENVRLTDTYGFYNGPATYMYVVGHKTDPVTLAVTLPSGWQRTYAPLASVPGRPHTYSAPDFDTLADSPLVAGDMVTREFTAFGRPHSLVFFNRHRGIDYDSIVPVAKKIVEEQNRMMGGPPYERYGFLFDVGGRGGGLEHLNSCRLAWARGMDPIAGAHFLAHEFFHLWCVKRIRPAVLGPFDYVNPPKTRNLWFAEGVTDYYGDMTVYRAGLIPESALYRGFAGEISSLQSNGNRLRVTADESSLRVWEAGNSYGYGGLSYYQKGKLIGLCLDLKLRALTGGRSSLDHVMRDLMARYGLPRPGFPEDGIRDAVIRAGGASMGPFYDRLCRSTAEMPFQECLEAVGLRLVMEGGRYSIAVDPGAVTRATEIRRRWLAGRDR